LIALRDNPLQPESINAGFDAKAIYEKFQVLRKKKKKKKDQ